MSTTLIYAARIAPRRLECSDCLGIGVVTRIVGSRRDSNNNVVPVESESRCDSCDGTGRAACCYCGSRDTVQLGSDGPMCDTCALEAE